ncbi:MAG: response regulator [Thermodesulfovibrionales bacterium]|nr:response regulator [Thermodesulfovibrionales bacterium]
MGRQYKLLLVEDNPANLELFCDILSITEYHYITTSNGLDAINIAKTEMPDLILLDIQLPGMDGLSVISKLREMQETRNTKIIALTAHAMKGDKEMFISKGFDDYISKPIKVKEFLAKIKEHLNLK